MAGALGVVLTGSNVPVEGSHAIPVYVDDSLPIIGPSRACVISTGEIPPMGGPPLAVRLAPTGTPALGPAVPVYVVPGGGILDTFAYTNKIKAMGPIAYWPMAEASGAVKLASAMGARRQDLTARPATTMCMARRWLLCSMAQRGRSRSGPRSTQRACGQMVSRDVCPCFRSMQAIASGSTRPWRIMRSTVYMSRAVHRLAQAKHRSRRLVIFTWA